MDKPVSSPEEKTAPKTGQAMKWLRRFGVAARTVAYLGAVLMLVWFGSDNIDPKEPLTPNLLFLLVVVWGGIPLLIWRLFFRWPKTDTVRERWGWGGIATATVAVGAPFVFWALSSSVGPGRTIPLAVAIVSALGVLGGRDSALRKAGKGAVVFAVVLIAGVSMRDLTPWLIPRIGLVHSVLAPTTLADADVGLPSVPAKPSSGLDNIASLVPVHTNDHLAWGSGQGQLVQILTKYADPIMRQVVQHQRTLGLPVDGDGKEVMYVGVVLGVVRRGNTNWTEVQLPDGREIAVATTDAAKVCEVASDFLIAEQRNGHLFSVDKNNTEFEGVSVVFVDQQAAVPTATPPWHLR